MLGCQANPSSHPPTRLANWAWGALVGLAAFGLFAWKLPIARPDPNRPDARRAAFGFFALKLPGTTLFADEGAFLSQSYFIDVGIDGGRNDPAWLSFFALDLVPLPKYLIGLMLRANDYPRPGPEIAKRWYFHTTEPVGTAAMRRAARWPSAVLGALGCVALYSIGLQAAGRSVGVLAGLLLALNPLYRLHACRAMADVPAEAFILLTAALGLALWKRTLARGWGLGPAFLTLAAGVAGGLAVAAKFNGVLGLMIAGGWSVLACGLPGFPWRRKFALILSFGALAIAAFGTFVALDPFLTAHPTRPLPAPQQSLAALSMWERCRALVKHRLESSADQQVRFAHNALKTLDERVKVVAVQGFGRFGPFGPLETNSVVRYDWKQDWGALIWLPGVMIGLSWAIRHGRAQLRAGEPPGGWAIAAQALIALGVVTPYLPMAWDRYMLSIQAGSALLAAGAVVWILQGLGSLTRGAPASEPP